MRFEIEGYFQGRRVRAKWVDGILTGDSAVMLAALRKVGDRCTVASLDGNGDEFADLEQATSAAATLMSVFDDVTTIDLWDPRQARSRTRD